MKDKEVYNGVFEMLSYTDALRHIVEHHKGGSDIVQNSSEMPIVWHELQHLNGDPGHFHLNDHKVSLERAAELVKKLSSDETFLESVIELVDSTETEETFQSVKEYLQEIKKDKE